MSADRWQRLNEIFHAALPLGPDERRVYVSEACEGDESLRLDLEGLLDAHHRADLDSSVIGRFEGALDELGPPALAGRRVGAYRVSAEIGRGGMGAVWCADRADGQFEQRVAIKVIKRGMDTAQVLERFRAERQILASLDHPNIARLIDGGTTDDGLPYFVMEHIQGQPIDEYADDRRLSVRQRLELFLHVCDAVSYAHQRLVGHRDIKPQNILVTTGGVPKLLDFGIAKVVHDASQQGALTLGGHQPLTPDYASPEQIEGRNTTTQTDVYSLGVVLYELLTGQSPYRPRTWSAPDVCKEVLSSDVERPSAAVCRPREAATRRRGPGDSDRAAPRVGNADRLRGHLRGDLDAIVLSALRKEPARRYASVEQFAGDIRRHLAGLPVRARTDSLWYRGTKFASRNRAASAATVLITVALAAGTVATAWQASEARRQAQLAQDAHARAERRFSEVRKLANTLLFDYHDAIKDLPGATPVRERLLHDARDHLNRLAAEAGGDPSLQRELALAYSRLAAAQGGSAAASLGDTQGSIDSYLKSLDILGALLAREPRDRATRHEVGMVSTDLAYALWETGDMGRALAHARNARGVFEALIAESPPDLNLRLGLARAYDAIGVLEGESGRTAQALDVHRRQLQLLESSSDAERRSPRVRRALSIAHHHIADAEAASGDLAGALESHRTSLRLRTSLWTEFPHNGDYRRLMATSHFYEGDILAKLGRTREALDAFRRSLAVGEELAAADPKAHTGDLAYALVQVGTMLGRLGDHARALDHYRRARAIREKEVQADPASLWKRASLIEGDVSICGALAKLARHRDASVACRDTAKLLDQTRVEPTNALIRTFLADSYSALGDAYLALGGPERSQPPPSRVYTRAARDMYMKSLEIWQAMAARAIVAASDAGKPEAVRRALAKTEAALQD